MTNSKEALEALEEVQAFVNESHGISGWHKNGDVCYWSELDIDNYLNIIRKALTEPEVDENEGYIIVDTISNNLAEFKWQLEFRDYYNPDEWLCSRRAATAFLSAKLKGYLKTPEPQAEKDRVMELMAEALIVGKAFIEEPAGLTEDTIFNINKWKEFIDNCSFDCEETVQKMSKALTEYNKLEGE